MYLHKYPDGVKNSSHLSAFRPMSLILPYPDGPPMSRQSSVLLRTGRESKVTRYSKDRERIWCRIDLSLVLNLKICWLQSNSKPIPRETLFCHYLLLTELVLHKIKTILTFLSIMINSVNHYNIIILGVKGYLVCLWSGPRSVSSIIKFSHLRACKLFNVICDRGARGPARLSPRTRIRNVT
jgi:hypothetical protein